VIVTVEGKTLDVEEYSLLADVSKLTSYITSKIGAKVRATVIQQDSEVLLILEKAV
jgi:hypothetical protein